MSSREQASAFRKHRDADDKQGNLAWASRVGGRALRVSPEAAARDVEGMFEFDELEKIVWRLLHLPRKYTDLEHAGLFDASELRSVLRGLVAADVVDIVDTSEAKALLPAEVKRLKAEVSGKEWRPKVGSLQAKVYRPDIGLDGGAAPASAPPTEAQAAALAPAPAAPAVKLTPDERKLKEQLLSAAKAAPQLSHYAFLGVMQGADDAVVRTAYVQLARDYHPDRLGGTNLAQDVETKTAVEQLFKRLGDANKAISNAEARVRYDRELALQQTSSTSSTTTGGAKKPRRAVEARNAYAMAETFFKRKEYKQAEIHYRQAVMFDGDEPMYQVALAWCIFLNPEHPQATRVVDAKKRFEELVKKTRNGEAYYRYGRILREAGEDDAALKAFQKCLEKTPDHHDAQREVRLHQTRKEKEAKQKEEDASLIGRISKAFKRD